jgi:hypothetical protein
MDVVKGVLSESRKHYSKLKKKLERDLKVLPVGSVKKRRIGGAVYFYLQKRVGNKVVHQYLGKAAPEELIGQVERRRALKGELKKVKEGLKLVCRAEGRVARRP